MEILEYLFIHYCLMYFLRQISRYIAYDRLLLSTDTLTRRSYEIFSMIYIFFGKRNFGNTLYIATLRHLWVKKIKSEFFIPFWGHSKTGKEPQNVNLFNEIYCNKGLLYHRTCKRDFLFSWLSINSYLKKGYFK